MPLHAFTHVQLALSERNREPVLTFFSKERFHTYQCFHTPASLLPQSTFPAPYLLFPVSPAQLPSQQQLQPPSFTPSTCIQRFLPYPSSLTLLLHLQQAATLIRTLSVEDAARVPPCSAPLALVPSPPFRFESGLRAAHVCCPILGTSLATGELFPA